MNRREFLIRSSLMTGGMALGDPFDGVNAVESPPSALRLHWTRDEKSRLFTNVQCDGAPLAVDAPGLLDGFCRLVEEAPEEVTTLGASKASATHGQLRMELQHQLLNSGIGSGEDVL